MRNKRVSRELVTIVFAFTLLSTVTLMPLKYAEAQNATLPKLGDVLADNMNKRMTTSQQINTNITSGVPIAGTPEIPSKI